MMKKGFGTKPESKVLVLSFAIVACVILAFYVAFVIRTTIVYTHLFYIPLLLAGMWYYKWKAVAVALFLGIVHILVTHLSPLPLSIDVFGRAVIFIVVAYVIGYVSEQRAKGENALRESEEKYRAFFKTSEDCVFITSKEGRWLDMNDAAVELLGYESRDEMLKVNVPDLYENQEERQRHLQLIEQHGFTKEFPVNLRRKDGSIINTLITSVAKKDVNGNVIGYQGTIRDITERKKAEAVLRESEEKYRLVVENANEAILVAQDGMLKFCNLKAVELTGYSKEELTSRTFVEFIHPDDLEMVVERHHKRLKGEELPHIYPFRVIDKGGNTVWVDINAVLITWAGRPATLNFLSDVTERKRAEDALRESEEKYRELAELLPEVIFETDLGGNITYANKVAFDSFGYTQSDFDKGLNALQMLNPEDRDRGKENIQRVLSGETIGSIEYTAQRKDKTTFPVIINSSPIIRENKPVGLRGVITNITERKRAEKEREGLLKELEAKNRELGRFTYTVSHDLRSPLITIQGFSDMVQTDLEQNELEKAKDNLTFIENAATKMEKLLSDTLELSRIGRMANPPEDVPFGEIVKEALEQTAEQIKSSGVEVSVAEDFPTVHVDRMRIAEVLVNLIVNSINYRGEQPHPKIEIGHRIDNGERVFFVRDNGIGIDPGQHEKVFDLFYQVDSSGKGTGAGLAIVKRIIEVHNGRIWIESVMGKGCTICFTLPVV